MKKKLPRVSSYAFYRRGYIVCFVFILLALIAVALSSRGSDLTNRMYDVIRTTYSREEVVIVGIDDKSLQALGAWPWERTVFADFARIMNESSAAVVVYDVLFLEPRKGDEEFKKELLSSTVPSVFAAKYTDKEYLSSYLAEGVSSVVNATANVGPDRDGKVRRFPKLFPLHEGCVLPLAQRAFDAYARGETPCDAESVELFRYPTSVTTYSLVDVVRGEVPKESFAGKSVFVGSVSLDLEDHFVGMRGDKIPGVYVHASIFTSLLNQVGDTPLSRPWVVITLTLFAALSGYAVVRMKSVYTQISSILGLLALGTLASVIVYSFGIIMPLPWLLVDILISAGYVTLVRFIVERRQNEHVQALFSKYVHKDVLAELMNSNTEIRLGGERKPVTVLFSDLRGFTSLSESLSPEELTATLNGYLSAMTPHILEEKGTIDKFIGDAIMAFWNAPLPVEHHPLHAVRSALRMHEALKRFNTTHGTELAMGIGIHTGQAVVGNVGGEDRVNYTILGDTVNLASRIEGLTKKYGVGTIVTKAVRDSIEDDSLLFRCLDVITVLGKTTPTALYEVRYAHDFPEGVVNDYEKAFKYYYEKQWNKAEVLFKKLTKKGDTPSEKILARIPELRKRDDWDGIWRFDEK